MPPAVASAGPPAALPDPDPVALREPAHQVCERAIGYWRTHALIGLTISLLIAIPVYLFVPGRPWWLGLLLLGWLLLNTVYAVVMPPLRYRIHRWELSPTAIHTRAGWLNTETRIAPLSRVQTVDSHQGALMRLFSLASLTVTTASAAGPITIAGLDAEEAKQLVATLTAITGASTGDAT